jgi:hypothetical protein
VLLHVSVTVPMVALQLWNLRVRYDEWKAARGKTRGRPSVVALPPTGLSLVDSPAGSPPPAADAAAAGSAASPASGGGPSAVDTAQVGSSTQAQLDQLVAEIAGLVRDLEFPTAKPRSRRCQDWATKQMHFLLDLERDLQARASRTEDDEAKLRQCSSDLAMLRELEFESRRTPDLEPFARARASIAAMLDRPRPAELRDVLSFADKVRQECAGLIEQMVAARDRRTRCFDVDGAEKIHRTVDRSAASKQQVQAARRARDDAWAAIKNHCAAAAEHAANRRAADALTAHRRSAEQQARVLDAALEEMRQLAAARDIVLLEDLCAQLREREVELQVALDERADLSEIVQPVAAARVAAASRRDELLDSRQYTSAAMLEELLIAVRGCALMSDHSAPPALAVASGSEAAALSAALSPSTQPASAAFDDVIVMV